MYEPKEDFQSVMRLDYETLVEKYREQHNWLRDQIVKRFGLSKNQASYVLFELDNSGVTTYEELPDTWGTIWDAAAKEFVHGKRTGERLATLVVKHFDRLTASKRN